MTEQKIAETLEYFKRHQNSPDLHSGMFNGSDAVAYVEYQDGAYSVDVDGREHRSRLTAEQATDVLKKYDFTSVSI
jgi:hypothetical protein